jgi:hypothetical protein
MWFKSIYLEHGSEPHSYMASELLHGTAPDPAALLSLQTEWKTVEAGWYIINLDISILTVDCLRSYLFNTEEGKG